MIPKPPWAQRPPTGFQGLGGEKHKRRCAGRGCAGRGCAWACSRLWGTPGGPSCACARSKRRRRCGFKAEAALRSQALLQGRPGLQVRDSVARRALFCGVLILNQQVRLGLKMTRFQLVCSHVRLPSGKQNSRRGIRAVVRSRCLSWGFFPNGRHFLRGPGAPPAASRHGGPPRFRARVLSAALSLRVQRNDPSTHTVGRLSSDTVNELRLHVCAERE